MGHLLPVGSVALIAILILYIVGRLRTAYRTLINWPSPIDLDDEQAAANETPSHEGMASHR